MNRDFPSFQPDTVLMDGETSKTASRFFFFPLLTCVFYPNDDNLLKNQFLNLKCSQLRCLRIVGVYSPALCSSTCAIKNRLYLIKQTSMSHMQPNTSCKGFFLCIDKPQS
uniref:Uncharacterized protein n=1 Tax=Populus trichocarpa TaxID=3694 RepID=A0A2K1ZLQ5_POPTR